MPKKKPAPKKKAAVKKKAATKKNSAVKKKPALKKAWKDFKEWWGAVASKKVEKIERDWIKSNEPNDPDEEAGGDHWHVNEMMHSGDAHEMTWEIAEEAFNRAAAGEDWEMTQCQSLYCCLDDVIVEAAEAGKQSRRPK